MEDVVVTPLDSQAHVCRSCGSTLTRTFVDLGSTPLANSYPHAASAPEEEQWHALHARVCDDCLLVQIEAVVPVEEIFDDYAYFSSYSDSWLEHSRRFAEQAVERWQLGPDSFVVEVASNDGYLLQYFLRAGVRVLGIDPAKNVGQVAESIGVPTEVAYLGAATGAEFVVRCGKADLIVANNVLAHVPDLNDFVAGLAALMAPHAVVSIEVPHLLNLIEHTQFDTIYHEHFSYFSLHSVEILMQRHGLRVFDVERITTHGGSLRIYVCRDAATHDDTRGLHEVRTLERDAGLTTLTAYDGFQHKVRATQQSLLTFLHDARVSGKSVVGYGAAAKGNTLLNSCHIGIDDVAFVVDRSPHKQGRLLPGSRIPVRDPAAVAQTRPDYLLILAWNIADEVVQQMAHVRQWGGAFVLPIPNTHVLP